MKNQTSSNPQNDQHSTRPPVKKNSTSKSNTLLLILLSILLSGVIFGLSGYYLGIRQNQTDKSKSVKNIAQTSSPTVYERPTVSLQQTHKPKLATFMRDGEIWIKDYQTSKERKISSTSKVGGPTFSPTAEYVTYFEIMHATGGFPRYSLYVSDKNGKFEKTFDMKANQAASQLKWSQDGKLLGAVLFANELPGSEEYKEEAYIYDPTTKQEILVGEVVDRQTSTYSVDSSCEELESSYISFCNEYVSYLSQDIENDYVDDYKREDFLRSQYTRPSYKLTRSKKLDNGLIVLEYYTGNPQNPEATWSDGGGSFYPGYDKGVTQTYTLLVDETSGDTIDEIDKAIDTDFYFGS